MKPQETIVLIHGLWEAPFMMNVLGYRLAKQGYLVKYFHYHSVIKDITANREKLFNYLQPLENQVVHLVGHSLGGLLILKLLEKHSLENVKSIVLLASPVNGSVASKAFIDKFYAKLIFGRSLPALVEGVQVEAEQQVGVIAGTGGMGVTQYFIKIPKPHDGVISVKEAELQGANEMITLPVSHFPMIFSRQVAENIVEFIQTGQFIAR